LAGRKVSQVGQAAPQREVSHSRDVPKLQLTQKVRESIAKKDEIDRVFSFRN